MVLQHVAYQFSHQEIHYENSNVTRGANFMDWRSFPFGGVSNHSCDSDILVKDFCRSWVP